MVHMGKSTTSDGFCTTSDGSYKGFDSTDCKLMDAMGGAPGGNDHARDLLIMVSEMVLFGALLVLLSVAAL